jgi:pimeloyl-ACP methyl ester carboxylesterase
MPQIQTKYVKLNYVEQGDGYNIVVFIHGNLACIDWMNLVLPKLPESIHYYAIDWRGCGNSEKPKPTSDYSNYSMFQHAQDMIDAIRQLGIKRCHLANHSTGGIICTHMLLIAPNMFNKLLCLDPVGPMGLNLSENINLFDAMKQDRDLTYAVLATAAPTLFDPLSLQEGHQPQFARHTTQEQKDLYGHLVNQAMKVSDGIWSGVPINLTKEFESGALRERQSEIAHEHLILWGEQDQWIPRAHMDEMVQRMPNCTLKVLQGVGHACNLEDPGRFAELFCNYFK